MSKLLLLSIVIAMVAIPTIAAGHPEPKQGLRRAVVRMLMFEAFYAFGLVYLWGRI